MAEVGAGGDCSGTNTCGKDPATGKYLVCYNGRCVIQADSLAYTAAFAAVDAAMAANPGSSDWVDASNALTAASLRGESISETGFSPQLLLDIYSTAPTFYNWAIGQYQNPDQVRAATLLSLGGATPVFDKSGNITSYQPLGDPINLNRVPAGLDSAGALALVGQALASNPALASTWGFQPPQAGSTVSAPRLAQFALTGGLLKTDPLTTTKALAGLGDSGSGHTATQDHALQQGGADTTTLIILGVAAMAAVGGALLLLRKPSGA